jgi:hypothetical protein
MPNDVTEILIKQLHEFRSNDPDLQYEAAISLGNTGNVAEERMRIVNEIVNALTPEHQALTRAHALWRPVTAIRAGSRDGQPRHNT